jgi:hypothetical protein
MRLPNASSNPSSPSTGHTYYNTTDKQVLFYNGTDWIGLAETVALVLTLTDSGGNVIEWDGKSDLKLQVHKEYTVVGGPSAQAVEIKMWGGGGACGFAYTQGANSNSNQGPGGGGGYTSGTITFVEGTNYVFRVGEGGIRGQAISSAATYIAGGLASLPVSGTEGGGYTGIFSGTSVTQGNALLIAGGGGGGSDTNFGAHGGAGGGSYGQSSPAGSSQGGNGGTPTGGGAGSPYNSAGSGSALTGGIAANSGSSHSWLGGGGGGYWGGGGGNVGGGGGGSGYFKNSSPVSSGSTTAGSSSTPGNSSDSDRGTAGNGGTSSSRDGIDGKIVLLATSP